MLGSENGFTLMEMMIVVIILSLTMGLGLFSLSHVPGEGDLKKDVRRLYALFTQLRHQAILDGKPLRLHLKMDGFGQAEYTLDNAPERVSTNHYKPFVTGETRLNAIKTQEGKRMDQGLVSILFSPQGLAQPTRFYLSDRNKEMVLTLQAFSPELKLTVRDR